MFAALLFTIHHAAGSAWDFEFYDSSVTVVSETSKQNSATAQAPSSSKTAAVTVAPTEKVEAGELPTADNLFFGAQLKQAVDSLKSSTKEINRTKTSFKLWQRDQFGSYLDSVGVSGAGVELGTADGDFANTVLKGWKGCSHMILVDKWTAPGSHHFVKKLMEPRGKKVSLLKMNTTAAAAIIPAKSLAFVYIDAGHEYKDVKSDIRLFWDKLIPGGVLAGHDYDEKVHPGVNKAVDEFAKSVNTQVQVTSKMKARKYITGKFDLPTCCPTWLLLKPTFTAKGGKPDDGKRNSAAHMPKEKGTWDFEFYSRR